MVNAADLIAAHTGEPWTRLHRRVLDAPGAVVDLGCVKWNWSRRFFGKHHVIGVDPFEDDVGVDRVELLKAVVTATRGTTWISRDGVHSSTRSPAASVTVEAVTLSDVLERYQVDKVAALKINTEGSEYEILISMAPELLARIDQIAVSFHDFKGYGSPQATSAVISYLKHWYDVTPIDPRWNWHLFTRR